MKYSYVFESRSKKFRDIRVCLIRVLERIDSFWSRSKLFVLFRLFILLLLYYSYLIQIFLAYCSNALLIFIWNLNS